MRGAQAACEAVNCYICVITITSYKWYLVLFFYQVLSHFNSGKYEEIETSWADNKRLEWAQGYNWSTEFRLLLLGCNKHKVPFTTHWTEITELRLLLLMNFTKHRLLCLFHFTVQHNNVHRLRLLAFAMARSLPIGFFASCLHITSILSTCRALILISPTCAHSLGWFFRVLDQWASVKGFPISSTTSMPHP